LAKVELVKRWEFQLLLVCSFLLVAAGLWVALWRPPKLIEGEFLAREDRADAADVWLIGQTRTPIAEDRARAMEALGRIGDPRSLDTLLAALKDEIPRVRASAAFAIGILQDDEYLATIGRKPEARAVTALLAALEDRERAVVTNAVEALGKMGQPEVGARLARSPAPLAITAVALARLGVRDAMPWLSQLLRSDDQNVRHAGAVSRTAECRAPRGHAPPRRRRRRGSRATARGGGPPRARPGRSRRRTRRG
jgi:HEAT repeat protein